MARPPATAGFRETGRVLGLLRVRTLRVCPATCEPHRLMPVGGPPAIGWEPARLHRLRCSRCSGIPTASPMSVPCGTSWSAAIDPLWRTVDSGLWMAAFTTAITVRGPLPGNCEVMCSLLSLIRSITGSTTSARRFACCA